jgi:hypothetical protein
MNVCGGTPYANVFKGGNKLAARLDLRHPSLPDDLKKLLFEAMDILHEHLEPAPA